MTDLIDRQAAIDALHAYLMYRMGTESNKKRLDEWINNLPSVQPEIIRCKDCIMHGLCRFEQGLGLDGYCSQAERSTDG